MTSIDRFFRIFLFLALLPSFSAGWGAGSPSVYDVPLSFSDTAGKSVRLSEFKGKPLVITMTYSSCQFACPRILQRLKNVQKGYRERGMKAEFVVVTFDPERDTPKRLAELQKKNADAKEWKYLSGKPAVTRQLSMILGIRYERNPDDGTISHDNKILILDEQGSIRKELNGLNPDVSEAFD